MAVACAAVVTLSGGETIAGLPGPPPTALAAAKTKPKPRVRAPRLTRFSVAGRCYRLGSAGRPVAAGDEPFRLQAAALGQYLIYGVRGDLLTDVASGATRATPSQSTVWRLDGPPFRLTNNGTGVAAPLTLTPASGCAVYPEAQVDAAGPTFKGAAPTAGVLGTMEGHAHITAFELFGGNWHCGRLWSPYGAPYALPASCAAEEQGTNGQFEATLDFGGANRPSDFQGWPTFHNWPTASTLAEEQNYWTGIERAWKAGLRLMVTDLVDNEVLCSLMTTRTNPCNDMASVHIQARDLKAFQDYIDAQSGGPGKGWLRLVSNPYQARRVINQGKLAVVTGIEVSRLFGCGETNGNSQCDVAQVNAGLDDIQRLGVSTLFPVHEFDNAFGGTKGISGETGAIVNAGNRQATGSFMTEQPCPAAEQDAPQVTPPAGGTYAALLNGPVASLLGGNPLPVYGPGPQCNTRGLTQLGAYLVRQMAKRHLVVQTDHSGSKTADGEVKVAEAERYAGIVSAHCCSSPQLFGRIYNTGGYINPPAMPPGAFLQTWRQTKALANPRFHFGFGYGSDMEGLAHQPSATNGTPVRYPFKSYDGKVTFTREVWGQRTFDVNTDGVANYGLYADWLAALQVAGGRPLLSDMFQGAESYLQMWERAQGVPATHCQAARGSLGTGGTSLGRGAIPVLMSLGQPATRPAAAYRWCVRGAPGRTLTTVFDRRGRTALWITNVARYSAGGVHPGARASALGRRARRIAPGFLAVGRSVYGVRRGRVRSVAVAAPALLRSRLALAAALRAAGVR